MSTVNEGWEHMLKIDMRNYARNVLLNKYINSVIRRFLKPIIARPEMVKFNIPAVVGKFKFKFNGERCFYLNVDGNDGIANRIYWHGLSSFEGDTIPLFLKLASKSYRILDIGANTGIYAILAAIQNPSANIFAFEPVPENFDHLKYNVEINSLKNVRLENYALSNYDGKASLYVPKGKIPTTASILGRFGVTDHVMEVPTIKLDTYCKREHLSDADLIKIDTEATEHLVIEGALETIKQSQPIIICEVLRGFTEMSLHSLLDDTGYEYFWISDEGLIKRKKIAGNSDKNMNYLFVTEKRKALLIESGYL